VILIYRANHNIPMSNRHVNFAHDHDYQCHRRKQICSLDNKTCRDACYKKRNPEKQETVFEFDNSDLVNDMDNEKLTTADERLATKAIQSGKKNKRAIDGAVRATREQFDCHLEDELDEHEKLRWWGNQDYDVDESNWMQNLEYFQDNDTY
jgi:hypothetical protein